MKVFKSIKKIFKKCVKIVYILFFMCYNKVQNKKKEVKEMKKFKVTFNDDFVIYIEADIYSRVGNHTYFFNYKLNQNFVITNNRFRNIKDIEVVENI